MENTSQINDTEILKLNKYPISDLLGLKELEKYKGKLIQK